MANRFEISDFEKCSLRCDVKSYFTMRLTDR